MKNKVNDLAEKLLARDYGNFFYYPAHTDTIEAIWNTPENRLTLKAIINSPAISMEAKFLASEILFIRNPDFINHINTHQLANVYAKALVDNYTGMANSWGMLYEFNDSGLVGQHFIQLGEAAVPVLEKLLDDDRITLQYVGSEEATVGNRYQFRVKDFAAFYLGKILCIPIYFYRENYARDNAIDQMKLQVKERNRQ